MTNNKMYSVSKALDVEVDYFVTKAYLAMRDAEEESFEECDFSRLEALEEKYDKLVDLQKSLIYKNGCFFVDSEHYELARECKNAYRRVH